MGKSAKSFASHPRKFNRYNSEWTVITECTYIHNVQMDYDDDDDRWWCLSVCLSVCLWLVPSSILHASCDSQLSQHASGGVTWQTTDAVPVTSLIKCRAVVGRRATARDARRDGRVGRLTRNDRGSSRSSRRTVARTAGRPDGLASSVFLVNQY